MLGKTTVGALAYGDIWYGGRTANPWNVEEAVAASGARLVDVSSGVERGAGLKDAGLIAAFLDAARRA